MNFVHLMYIVENKENLAFLFPPTKFPDYDKCFIAVKPTLTGAATAGIRL